MKSFIKMLVIAFCCVSCITPFTVFAEDDITEYGSYDEYLLENSATFLSDVSTLDNGFDNSTSCVNFLELPYSQRQAIINLEHSGRLNNLVFLTDTGDVYTCNAAWFNASTFTSPIIVYFNTDESSRGWSKIDSSGNISSRSTSNLSVSIISVFYWSRNSGGSDPFGSISFDGSLCQVTPEPTSTPFPSADPFACNFALNEVISNDYVASLVAYAEKQNYTEPYFIYRVYYSDSADDMNILSNSGVYTELQPFSIKGYVLALEGYAYPQTYVLEYKQLRKLCTESACAFAEFDLLDSIMYPYYELVLSSSCLEKGEFSEIQATQDVNASIQQTISQNATSISNQNTMINQNQQIIDSTNQTNDLIENGTDTTHSILIESGNVPTTIVDSLTPGVEFEETLSSSILESTSSQILSPEAVPGFINAAAWVRTQFSDIWSYSPLGTAISFCLMIGVVSLAIGRKE